MARKLHVQVDQEDYIKALWDGEGAAFTLEEIATLLDVSEATAKKKLNGLIDQERVEKFHSSFGTPFYRLTELEKLRQEEIDEGK